MTRPTRKKAHHMPALKMVSIAPQPLRTTIVNNNRNKILLSLITKNLAAYKISTIIPIYTECNFLHTGGI
jgi:hypothetical protein